MSAKTFITILIVNAVIIAIVIGSFSTSSKDAVLADAVKPDDVAERNYITDSVRVVLDDDQAVNTSLNAIKAGLSYFNPKDIQKFNDDNWRIIISKELDFTDTDYTKMSDAEKDRIKSFINVETKIVQIRADKNNDGYIKEQTVICMCRFIDYINGYMSSLPEYEALVEKYPGYVEYRYFGTDRIISGANTDRFALMMRDYLMNEDYVLQYYPEVFGYFEERFPQSE